MLDNVGFVRRIVDGELGSIRIIKTCVFKDNVTGCTYLILSPAHYRFF